MPSVEDSKAKSGTKTAKPNVVRPNRAKPAKSAGASKKTGKYATNGTKKSAPRSKVPADPEPKSKKALPAKEPRKPIVVKSIDGREANRNGVVVMKVSQSPRKQSSPAGGILNSKLVGKMRHNGSGHSSMMANSAPSLATSNGKSTKAASSASSKKANGKAKPIEVVLPPNYKPSESEPFMNARHRMYFRNKLKAWKDDILRQNMETLKGLHDDSAQQADPADRATAETDRALELRARDRQRKLMGKIDAALARIEDGTYGYCEETGEPINLKRLDARPIATLSLEAQERRERRERVFRED